MTIGINIKNKEIFALNSFAKQNRTIDINSFSDTKNSGKRLSLTSVTKDSISIKYSYLRREGL